MQNPAPKETASEEWPHWIEIFSNNCKGIQSLHMGKVGFPLDALKFEKRSSTSIAQLTDSGSLRPPKLEATNLKDTQQLWNTLMSTFW